jgi:hypothetical protein
VNPIRAVGTDSGVREREFQAAREDRVADDPDSRMLIVWLP